jgi:hypothetical protein
MLKRIKDRFTVETEMDTKNKYGYRPSEEELETGMSFDRISKLKRKYDF